MLMWINERDRIREENSLHNRAAKGFLTKVMNRRGMEHAIKQNQSLCDQNEIPCSVILLDLDDFKKVNNKYGRVVGDNVLFNVANICSHSIKQTDIIGRWDGDQFVILTPGLDCSQAKEVAVRLRNLLKICPQLDVGVVTASFGVAGMRKGEVLQNLMARVDESMNEAKNTKNCVVVSE
jgi:diguanylate cyclase (GGDEF)-like protein